MIYGITGRIGSGKSYVCNLMKKKYGAIIFNSDRGAKMMYDLPDIKKKICTVIDKDFYNKDGTANTKHIINVIGKDRFKLRLLGHIIHPEVLNLFLTGCDCIYKNNKDSIIVIESAILFDIGWDQYVDKTIWVNAPFSTRAKRVSARSGLDYMRTLKYMSLFPMGNTDMLKADYVIENKGKNKIDLSFVRP